MDIEITLVNPPGDILINEHLEPPLGLLSIASYVQERIGIRCNILDLTKYDILTATKILLEINSDIYGFTVYCTKWNIVRDLISELRAKRGSNPLVVLGGPNATAIPRKTIDAEGVDIVVTGEGEKAFCQILEEYLASGSRFERKRIIKGERLKPNEFPVLNFTFVDPPETYGRWYDGKPFVVLEASRGCRNKCIFCNSVVMGGGSIGGIIGKSPHKIITEIAERKESGHNLFRFNDDSFSYAAYENGLLDQLKEVEIDYRIFANAKHLTYDVLHRLKDSGCFHISVGIESYNPDNLRIIGKNTDQSEIRSSINRASEMGIKIRAYFIVGLPHDTAKTIETYMNQVAQEVLFDEYSIYPLIPYPGSRIHKSPMKYGYEIIDDDINNYIQIGKGETDLGKTAFVLRHKNFTEHDVKHWLEMTDQIFDSHGKVQTLRSETT